MLTSKTTSLSSFAVTRLSSVRIGASSVQRGIARAVTPCCCSLRLESRPQPLQQIGTRFYSPTTFVWKKDQDDGTPKYQTINSTLTDEQIEKILAEEEQKMIEEQRARFVPNWKPGMRKKPLEVSYDLEEFKFELEPGQHKQRWTLLDKRCGALAIKVGMMPVFDDWGVRHPCTILYMDNNVVLGHKTMEEHGYMAVKIAAGQRKRKNVGKCLLGQYQNLLQEENENPPYLVREFRISDEAHLPPLYTRIHARHFVPGQNVDVSGTSKGKGFQGGMKRHNFGGLGASHGVSVSHRAIGSVGSCQDPGKVFKGKKMPGHMGHERVTTQNLRVIKVDRGRDLIYVIGAVPGNKGEFVEIRDAVKKPLWRTDLIVGKLDRPPLPTFEFDPTIDGCGEAGYDEFMPLPDKDPLAPDLDDVAA